MLTTRLKHFADFTHRTKRKMYHFLRKIILSYGMRREFSLVVTNNLVRVYSRRTDNNNKRFCIPEPSFFSGSNFQNVGKRKFPTRSSKLMERNCLYFPVKYNLLRIDDCVKTPLGFQSRFLRTFHLGLLIHFPDNRDTFLTFTTVSLNSDVTDKQR